MWVWGFHPFQGRPSFGQVAEKLGVSPQTVRSFHPFQGRPSFGPQEDVQEAQKIVGRFPSLSGKTFIRTLRRLSSELRQISQVSIPFREDLHSDPLKFIHFHQLRMKRFHPFQGRPSFGQSEAFYNLCLVTHVFPSLSGKTFIRTLSQGGVTLHPGFYVSIPFREDLHSDR